MPLFGSKKNDANKLEKHRDGAPQNAERAAYSNAQADLPTHGHGHGGAAQADPNMGGGRHHHRADPIPPPSNANANAGGMRTDALPDRQYGGAGAGIPPTATLHDPQQPRGGMTGKIETAAGELVGSNALKTKGMQKRQEAQALDVQSSELAEAERLERDAALRRERAVAHGAHPENRQLGGAGAGAGGGRYT